MIYSLWWEKPLDIEEPEIIPVKGEDVVNFAAAMCMCSKVEPYRLYPGCIKDSQINISVLWSPSQFDSRPVRNHGSHATHAMHRIQRFFEWAL